MANPEIIESPPPLPPRPEEAHKGAFGTVIVLGGCRTMLGAPAFCAGGALRVGAGRAKMAVAPEILSTVLGIEPGATGIEMHADSSPPLHAVEKADIQRHAVLAVGPGWGSTAQNGPLLESILTGPRRIVLDADGLNCLASLPASHPRSGPPLILTPHPGEYRRLADAMGIDEDPTNIDARPRAAAALATAHEAVVVLKGHRTVVSDGGCVYENTTGNPALAVAGSGDVLTGMIAGLWAQSMSAMEAAVLGTYLHGAAADLWAKRYGPRGLTATGLLDLLAPAMAGHGVGR